MRIPVSLLAFLFQLSFLLAACLQAQDQQELKEPETADQFFFFISPGQFKPLEQQPPEIQRSKSLLAVQGNRSTVRFVQGEPLAFVIRLASENGDPANTIQLVRLKPQGNKRMLERIPGTGSNSPFAGAVPIELTPYEESSLKIKLKTGLTAGEFALVLLGTSDVFCFGVDAPSKELK